MTDPISNEEMTESVSNGGGQTPEEALITPAKGVIRGDQGIETAQVWLSAFLILVIGLGAYWCAWRIPFQGEDQALFVSQNALRQVITVPDAISAMPQAPLTLFGYAVNGWLGRTSPAPLHAISLLLHLANAVMLYLAARRLLGKGIPEPVAMLAGLFFVVHPIATEGVDYLVGRPGVQATFFSLAALLLFLEAVKESQPRYGRACAALGCYVLASGSLAAAMALPLALAATDMALGGPAAFRRNRLIHGMFFGAMLAMGVAWHAAGIREITSFPAGFHATLATQSAFFLRLIQGVFIPTGMDAVHAVPVDIPVVILGLLSLLTLGGILAAALVFRSAAATGLAWGLAMTCAAICLTPLDVVLADRQLYLPAAGLMLLLPWGFSFLKLPSARVATGIAMAALIALGCYATYQRTALWADPMALWNDAAANNPASIEPWKYMGRYLVWQEERAHTPEQRLSLTQNAEQIWRSAVQTAPDDAECQAQYGIALQELGKNEEARPRLQDALRANPFDNQAVLHLALLYEAEAQHATDSESLRRAYELFQRAEKLGAMPPEAQARYGMVCGGVGDFENSVRLLRPLAGENPDAPFAPMLKRFKKLEEQAKKLEETATKQLADPAKRTEGLLSSAEAASLRGDFLQAGYYLDMALQRAPDNAQAWALLGVARARTGSAESFLKEWGTKLTVSPEAWNALATRCAAVNAWEAALAYLQFSVKESGPSIAPYLALADAAVNMRQPQRAETLLQKAAEVFPSDPAPWLKQCDIEGAAKNPEKARIYLEEARKRGASSEELQKRETTINGAAPVIDKPVGTILQ